MPIYFEKLQTKNEDENFANPRNLAAGSVRQLNPQIAADRNLSLNLYDLKVLKPNPLLENIVDQKSLFKFFDSQNLPHAQGLQIFDNIKDITTFCLEMNEQNTRLINDTDIDGLVIRTSWLYSSYGNNFVKTMLRLGADRDELGVIFDQVGTPTYARDLAHTCLSILYQKRLCNISENGKLYHFSNEGVASWFDFAKEIMHIGEVNCKVKPIETKDYPTLAKRPHFSVLNKSKIKKDFEIEIPFWKNSLVECILKLNNK